MRGPGPPGTRTARGPTGPATRARDGPRALATGAHFGPASSFLMISMIVGTSGFVPPAFT